MRVALWVVVALPLSLAYRFIIIPGLGGSILYNQKSQKIWPPEIGFQPTDLSIQNYYHRHDLSTTGEIGNTDSIRIDNRAIYMLTKNTYYTKMIDTLSSRNNQVHAFPYDFRFIQFPEYHEKLFSEYKKFIERHSRQEKFVLVAHSMGGLLIHHFLHFYVDKKWAAKHIAKVYYINTPFGGCPTALFFLWDSIEKQLNNRGRDQLLFNNYVLWLMLSIHNIHLFGGLYVCLPITKDPIMRVHRRWVYHKDIHHLLTDDWCAHTYRLTRPFFRKRESSPHDIHQVVVYSSGRNTTVCMDYDNEYAIQGDGDGLVPIESLLHPQLWKKPPTFVHVPGQDHSNINNHPPVLEMILENRDTLERPTTTRARWWFF
jgi:pimeloyl-ACP methyl ester carboxylesterase